MNLAQKVEGLMRERPHLKDSDDRLVATIWYEKAKHHSGRFTKEGMEGVHRFLLMLAEGDLPNYKSIVRNRQKLQKDYVDLRGKRYEERQAHAKDWAHKYGSKKYQF